ncbi:CLUMA_CG014333, isoform A [Clunio marinus]|uniref:CLUMA_CG014333, isoform A n=1 Tax=Clunio marinus TaxID=568069 RepID=A0A1J1ILQ3_9DIPT|nr:CLUMA_CG014333, isoform A [Clunio marinus]
MVALFRVNGMWGSTVASTVSGKLIPRLFSLISEGKAKGSAN